LLLALSDSSGTYVHQQLPALGNCKMTTKTVHPQNPASVYIISLYRIVKINVTGIFVI
jgi:hypothetical protein